MAKSKQAESATKTKPDIRKRTDIEAFLLNHPRYLTSAAKDGPTSYANQVDLGNITGPDAFNDETVRSLAKSVADGTYPCDEWDASLIEMLQGFTKAHGYMPGFAGPNAEWLVLRVTAKDPSSGEYMIYPNKGLDMGDKPYEDMKIAELRERAKLVMAFDDLCTDIRNQFIDTILTGHLFERPLTKRKKERFFSVCDLDQFVNDNPGISHVYSVPDDLKS